VMKRLDHERVAFLSFIYRFVMVFSYIGYNRKDSLRQENAIVDAIFNTLHTSGNFRRCIRLVISSKQREHSAKYFNEENSIVEKVTK
jgi:hypothetical protein